MWNACLCASEQWEVGERDVGYVKVQGSQGKRPCSAYLYVSTGRPEKEGAVVRMCAERLRKEGI